MSLALATLLYEWKRYSAAMVALAFSGLLILAQVGMFTGIVKAATAPARVGLEDLAGNVGSAPPEICVRSTAASNVTPLPRSTRRGCFSPSASRIVLNALSTRLGSNSVSGLPSQTASKISSFESIRP